MATAFARQLREIAAHSTNELDLKARRNAHTASLLFEREVAVRQDWESLFQICVEGYRELCTLDARFREFESNLFSATSRNQDREQMNRAQNEDLDATILRCLHLLGPRLLLLPGLRALEWLVRRFRVHVHNVGELLLTTLHHHEFPVFQNILNLISPDRLIDEWKFLRPYQNTTTRLPRSQVVYAATTNKGFFSLFNEYTLQACRTHLSETRLLRFWGGIVVEAVAGRLSQAKSGRPEIEQQRTEDILHQILPLLDEGLTNNMSLDLTVTCFSLALVLAMTATLSDEVLDSLLDAVSRASAFPGISEQAALISLKFFRGVLATLLRYVAKKDDEEKYQTITRVLKASISFERPEEVAAWFALLVNEVQRLGVERSVQNAGRNRLINLLQEFSEAEEYQEVFQELRSITNQHNIDLESLLQISIPSPPSSEEPAKDEDVEMTDTTTSNAFETALAAVPAQLPTETDFFAATEPAVFQALRSLLHLCYRDQTNLEFFRSLPMWTSLDASQYVLFLLRILFSDEPNYLRTDAATLLLTAVQQGLIEDLSQLLPFLSVLLADDVVGVRRIAAAAVAALETKIEEANTASNGGTAHSSKPTAIQRSITQLYLPNIEEFITDGTRIRQALKHGLNGTIDKARPPSKDINAELPKNVRTALLEGFARVAAETPLLRFKIGVIAILDGVTRGGSTAKTEAFLPILTEWAIQNTAQANALASKEGLSLLSIDRSMAAIITSQPKNQIEQVLDFLEAENLSLREQLVSVIFDRVIDVWPDVPTDRNESLALRLFDMSFHEQNFLADIAKAALHQIHLSESTLQAILENAMSHKSEIQDQPPTKKRRTSSHGGSGRSVAPLTAAFRESLVRLTLALDLVEGSKPEHHPGLLAQLTEVLLHLRRSKDQLQADSPYLVAACLGSMLAIVDKLKSARRPSIDWNHIRADVIADYVRTSDSSQVQSQALALSASLAEVAPDKVLHHIMPVFTFMGKTRMITQNNQHSINVVNEAIDRIVPSLVATLRKQDSSKMLLSTKTLLSSFVASFDHISETRKVPLFQRLLRQLGSAEFGFVLVAMLELRGVPKEQLDLFLAKLFGGLPHEAHLSTYRNLVILAQDCFAPNPGRAEVLLELSQASSGQDRADAATKILLRAETIIENEALRVRSSKTITPDSNGSPTMEDYFRESLLQTLETTKALQVQGGELQAILGHCSVELLRKVSVRQLIKLLVLLSDEAAEIDDEVKAQALQSLARKLQQKGNIDTETATAALDYLSNLQAMISGTDDVKVQVAAIRCVDGLCARYGRRDVNKLLDTAVILAGDAGLSSSNENVQAVAAHTLASLVLMMREAAVPIVSQALQGALHMIENSHVDGSSKMLLHNAGFSLITSLAQGVSFMLSEDDVGSIAVAAAECAFSDLPNECEQFRREALTPLAENIDFETFLQSLMQKWEEVVEFEKEGILPTLEVLAHAIDHQPKTTVVQAADKLSSLLLKVFDVRRHQAISADEAELEADDLAEIELKANEIALKFIYKLSDGVFRPIFETWVDWATNPRDLSEGDVSVPEQKLHRQITLSRFLAHFFSTLKSIVTSYASYLLKPVNDSLAEFYKHCPTSPSALLLYTTLLTALSEAFKHDADGFFTAPSHFETLARNLVNQLELASNKHFRPLVFQNVLPTIVAFATAVQDTSSHHLAINHYLAQLRHADSQHVRLASIRTHLALTEDEEVGEEWVDNIVSGTANVETLMAADSEDDGSKGFAGVGGRGETMIYVNEMLEDDDEEVEREVRRWVRMVREKVGEDVFET
ncbi:U3 small nucleolar RNA-associated protein 10 [Cyphellophora attinorum]|uniref:U3 small nucleolar RNA-associated protein 10 n=1 Tax=Cyphellophora attinorum TaxID=1664694 RepID=A0A0N1P1T8_9EURO|nr:U3 small nucleolar RNA-associated protein 10 [Phialophora attinorum]KPI44107.1 U3 small nucleolar RNA-associated protein 10 [Phialophora attinorum]